MLSVRSLLFGPLLGLSLLLTADAAAGEPRWEPGARSAERYNEGAAQLQSGDPLSAEAAFRAVLKKDDGCGMALMGLGMALLRQHQEVEAVSALAEAAGLFPERAEVQAALSEAAFVTQDFAAAEAAAERAVSLNPQYFPGQVTLFNARVRVGDIDGATIGLDRARMHHGSSRVDCLELELRVEEGELRTLDDLWASCQRSGEPALIATAGVSRARALGDSAAVAAAARAAGATELAGMAEVNARLEVDDMDGARALLDGLIEASPNRPDPRLLRANILLVQGDRSGARADLEAVIAGGTWVNVDASGGLSGVVRYSGQLRLFEQQVNAGATLARLRAEDGDMAGAAAALAEAKRRGERTATLSAAEAAVAFAGADEQAGWAALTAGLVRWPDAAPLAEVAGEQLLSGTAALSEAAVAALMGATDWTVRFNLAARRFNAGEPAAALEALAGLSAGDGEEQVRDLRYRGALALDDLAAADALLAEDVTPTLHHVWLRGDVGDHEGALSLLEAVPAEADATRAGLLRVVALCELGRLDEAQAAVSESEDGQALIWVAQALLAQGENAAARPILERACPLLEGDDAAGCRGALEQL